MSDQRSDIHTAHHVQDGRPRGWFWVENAIFDAEISHQAKLVYLYLCRCANGNGASWPSIKRISTGTGISIASVKRALDELIDGQYLDRQSGQDGGNSNTYTVLRLEGRAERVAQAELPPSGVAPCELGVAQGELGGSSQGATEGVPIEGRLRKETTTPLFPPQLQISQPGETWRLLSEAKDTRQQARVVLAHLNYKTGCNFRFVPTNLKLIQQRLKSGIKPEELVRVVNKKAAEWKGDAKMEIYLRPTTLFRETNCEQYVGAVDQPVVLAGVRR